jgi:hypothetical protein
MVKGTKTKKKSQFLNCPLHDSNSLHTVLLDEEYSGDYRKQSIP